MYTVDNDNLHSSTIDHNVINKNTYNQKIHKIKQKNIYFSIFTQLSKFNRI